MVVLKSLFYAAEIGTPFVVGWLAVEYGVGTNPVPLTAAFLACRFVSLAGQTLSDMAARMAGVDAMGCIMRWVFLRMMEVPLAKPLRPGLVTNLIVGDEVRNISIIGTLERTNLRACNYFRVDDRLPLRARRARNIRRADRVFDPSSHHRRVRFAGSMHPPSGMGNHHGSPRAAFSISAMDQETHPADCCAQEPSGGFALEVRRGSGRRNEGHKISRPRGI